MFLNDPFILNRHLPAGELHHLRACSSMRTVERGPFHCLRHAVLKSPTYIDYLSRWRESLAALSVLYSSMQIVVGPTPPGTGVIHAARSFAVSNSTSPDSFPLLSRFTPTSITTAPGLTHSPRTKPALPIATTRISARATSSLSLRFANDKSSPSRASREALAPPAYRRYCSDRQPQRSFLWDRNRLIPKAL